MENIQILKQLLNRQHLSPKELETAENLVCRMRTEIESRKPRKIDFTRVNSDTYGNPRYVCHFTEIHDDYGTAVKMANSIGGRKFNNKQYGGGVVFQSYNIDDLNDRIIKLSKNGK